jgi:succinoglycan biosynthesis transport protein ExoP
MTQSTGELVTSALRRALPLVVVLVLIAVATVNLKRQLDGAVYSASARVVLSTTDLGAVVAGLQPQFIDPDRVMQNALALARSPELYERVADKVGSVSPDELQRITSVRGSDQADVISFTIESPNRELAVEAANAVADEFPVYRAEISLVSVREALSRLRAELATAAETRRPALEDDLRRLELLETLTTGNAVPIERADKATQISPSPIRDSLFGAAIGLIFGLLISGLRQILDTRVWSEADVEALLDAPVVATIPSLPKRAKIVTIGRHSERYGDSYALLAAHVMQLRRSKPLVVAITSATKEEGKSITAANLAIALMQRGARVVLADFDLRRPSVARIFGIPSVSPGVLQVMRDKFNLTQALQPISLNSDWFPPTSDLGQANGQPHDQSVTGSLRVLPAGGSAQEALSHLPRAPQLIKQLSTEADVVVIDTPPALSSAEVADLSRLVDLIFVVARVGKAPRRSLRALARQAQSWQSEIGGVIVTDSGADDSYTYYSTLQR